MHLAKILSKRFVTNWPSYHLIYEWEDILANSLKIPIASVHPLWHRVFINRYVASLFKIYSNDAYKKFKNSVESINPLLSSNKNLAFELYVNTESGFSASKFMIPILVDFWKHTSLTEFYKAYKKCALVLVSSLEVFQYLQINNCPLNIEHFPLSLPDSYQLKEEIVYPKSYDIIIAGRSNMVLQEYVERFTLEYPGIEVLQQQQIEGELHYVSNKRGLVGKFHSRSEYMTLLRSCKIAFYSTPGIDGGELRTGGFNPVTPRFLELLSAQCLLLGRYMNNVETEFYELEEVCPNVQSYSEFKLVLMDYLHQSNPSFSKYQKILAKHYTSCRAELLRKILSRYS